MKRDKFLDHYDNDNQRFRDALDELLKDERNKAHPDSEADGYVFCGKCGKMK